MTSQNLTIDQIKQSLTNIHFEIEVAKLNNKTVQELVAETISESEATIKGSLDEVRKIIKDFSVDEMNEFKSIYFDPIISNIDKAYDIALVAITTNTDNITDQIGLDVTYAKEYVALSKKEFKQVVNRINAVFDELLKLSESTTPSGVSKTLYS